MTLPAARTSDEAHVYLDLHPCPQCGGVEVDWQRTRVVQPDGPAIRYAGACACGTPREFVFAEPEQPAAGTRQEQPVTGAGRVVFFGGVEPSRLLDAGEWLLVADLCERAADVVNGVPADAEACESLWTAVAALTEVLKFVPPDAREVPDAAFWSPRGHAVRQLRRARFDRERLLADRDRYRRLLDRAVDDGLEIGVSSGIGPE